MIRPAISAFSSGEEFAPEGGDPISGQRKASSKSAAVATPLDRSSKGMSRLRARQENDPWPENASLPPGTRADSPDVSEQRLWYLVRPTGEQSDSLVSSMAFESWVQSGAVRVTGETGAVTEINVVDVIAGTTIVMEADANEQLNIRREFPALEVMPSAGLYPQYIQTTSLTAGVPISPAAGQPTKKVVVTVTSAAGPVPDVPTRGYLTQGGYIEVLTDAQGVATLEIPKSASAQLNVGVLPKHTYWSSMHQLTLADEVSGQVSATLVPLTPTWTGAFHPNLGPSHLENDGKGVKVGIVDTGAQRDHPLLTVTDGASLVVGETDLLDWSDQIGHGTMVAGLIAAKGDGINTPRGLAPAVELRVYRVFGRGALKAEEVAVSKAIRQAVADGCDLVNLSLGGRMPMLEVQRAMNFAQSQGVVCVVAAGNDRRKPVSFPACCPEALAVSAMGRTDGYPGTSEFVLSESNEIGLDSKNYVSLFTNVGDTVDLCAPGVGIVSTWLDGTVAAMNGTSFAAPLVTGLLARALSAQQGGAILHMEKTIKRAEAIRELAVKTASKFGFSRPEFEGHGLPR